MVKISVINEIFENIIYNYKCNKPGYVRPDNRPTRKPTKEEMEFIENFNEKNYLKGTKDIFYQDAEIQQDYEDEVGFPIDQVVAVEEWGEEGYTEMNGRIYDTDVFKDILDDYEGEDRDEYLIEVDNKIESLQSAIDESPNIPSNTILFRGGHWDVGTQAGEVITQDGFASLTYYENGVFNKGYKMKIYVPSGTKGLWLNEPFDNLEEYEYLTGQGTRYYVLDVDDDNRTASLVILP